MSGQYGIIDGVYVQTNSADDPFLTANGEYCTLRNYVIEGGGVDIGPGSAHSVDSNSCVYNGEVFNCGEWNANHSADMHGFKISGSTHHVWILELLGYHLQGDTIQIGDANGNNITLNNIFMGGIKGYENKENLIDLKDCSYIVISGGWSRDFYNSWGDDAGTAITIHDEAFNTWVVGHDFQGNCNTGIEYGGDVNTNYCVHCTFRDFDGSTGSGWYNRANSTALQHRIGSAWIVNNTFHNCRKGILVNQNTSAVISNNLFSGRAEVGADYWDIGIQNASALDGSDYNLFDEAEGARIVQAGSTYTSLSAWQAATVYDDGSVEGAPRFVDEPANNFRIMASSDAIDAGDPVLSVVYTAFESQFSALGATLRVDYDGNSRPTFAQDYDIGAFEKQKLYTGIEAFGDSWTDDQRYTPWVEVMATNTHMRLQNRAVDGAPSADMLQQARDEITAGVDTTAAYYWWIGIPNDFWDVLNETITWAQALTNIENNCTDAMNELIAAGVTKLVFMKQVRWSIIPYMAALPLDPGENIDDYSTELNAVYDDVLTAVGSPMELYDPDPWFVALNDAGNLLWQGDGRHPQQSVHDAFALEVARVFL
jgi:hypothetical protein